VNRIVIDASIAVKWQLSDEADAACALEMLHDYAAEKLVFVAPQIWQYEIANVFNKAVSIGRLTETEGRNAVDMLCALEIELIAFPPPLEAYTLARKYQRSVFDSLYLAAAETNGIHLWTSDRKLYNTIRDRFSFVRWIGDYKPLR
jgi:predicted nucleic acid-binding protein